MVLQHIISTLQQMYNLSTFFNVSILLIVLILTWRYVPQLFIKKNNTTFELGAGSFVSPGWEKVADVFRKHLTSGVQKGGAFAVYYKGQLVVDLSGGYAIDEAHVPFECNTLSTLYSATKGISAMVMAILVDRGLLDYSKPVSHYWPEFAQNGKDKITVKQLLSHQAGLPVTDEMLSFFDFNNDPDKVERVLAQQIPHWTPGEEVGYHGITLGLYEDQLVRRVDSKHRSLPQFFQEEVAIPFDVDLYIGLPKEYFYRLSRTYPASILSRDVFLNQELRSLYWNIIINTSQLSKRVFSYPKEMPKRGMFNNPLFMEANSPSTHGAGTAKAVAKLYGILANGGKHETKTLLSESLIQQLNTPVVSGRDKMLGRNVRFGHGLSIWESPVGGLMFGGAGNGGQIGFADTEHGLGWGYLMNHLSLHIKDPMCVELMDAMYECVKSLSKQES